MGNVIYHPATALMAEYAFLRCLPLKSFWRSNVSSIRYAFGTALAELEQ